MTFMMQDQKLMTTDARGRVRVPVERREALLHEFERSGVKFAQMVGVKYPTFALWVQKRRKARKLQAGAAQAVTFAATNNGTHRNLCCRKTSKIN